MRMPASSQFGSIGRRLMARPAARRAVQISAHACMRCSCPAPAGGRRMMTSSTPGILSRIKLHPLEHAFLVMRRGGQRYVTVEVGVAEIGMGGEEHPLVERLEVALGLGATT